MDALFFEQLHSIDGWLLDEIRESLQNVRALFIDEEPSAAMLSSLLRFMPNLTSLTLLSGGMVGNDHSFELVPCLLSGGQIFTKLDLRDIVLHDEQLIGIVNLYSGNLVDVRLKCCELSQIAYEALSICTKLRCLSLERPELLEDTHLRAIIRKAPELESLSLFGSKKLIEEALELVGDIRGLRRLKLEALRGFEGGKLGAISKMTSLQKLSLLNIKFEIKEMEHLRHLTDLRKLELCAAVTPEAFAIICGNFRNLEKLRLAACLELTDADGTKLRHLKHLRSLKLEGAFRLTDLTFAEGLNLPSLEVLFISGCGLTDVGLAGIAAHHARLKHLSLPFCERITDRGLAVLLRRQTRLRNLSLVACTSLTGGILTELVNICPRLEEVNIYSVPSVSLRALGYFKRRRPQVTVFNGE